MIATGLLFVGVTAVVKHLGDRLPPAQMAFLRYALGLIFVPTMIAAILRARLNRLQLGLFALRGGAQTVGVILWFFAMTRIPIAEVTAMNYLVPVYVTLGAALLLGERLAARRIAAIIVALLGMLIILRPGLRAVEMGHLAMLGTAILFAISYLIAKKLAAELSATVIVGMLSLTVFVGLFPFAYVVWLPPSWAELGWLFLVACFATAGHFTMTLAFAAAPVAVTQPVVFLQLIWASLLGAVFFLEPLDIYVIVGGAVIIAAISFIAWREALASKRRATAPAADVRASGGGF